MMIIDGRTGEGGGQILRTSLALSLLTGKPFRMVNVRSKRSRPGLLRQHLTAVEAAASVGGAEVSGASVGSPEISFAPRAIAAGDYRFSIGTAGSASLVLQTILPALLHAPGPSSVVVEGGTHAAAAPPFEFLAESYLPQLARMGARAALDLDRPGFYPAGGGQITARVTPLAAGERLAPLSLLERGGVTRKRAIAIFAGLPFDVAERELSTFGDRLGWPREERLARGVRGARGPGNVLLAVIESEHLTEVFCACGERGKRAEAVGNQLADEVEEYLASGAPVGRHLADQLLLPMAIGGGGVFRTLSPSGHTSTQLGTLRLFLERPMTCEQVSETLWEVRVAGAASQAA